MRAKKNEFCWVFSALIACLSGGCGSTPSSPTLTFSHILSEQSEWHVGAVKWKELVEEKLGGRPAIRLVPGASLSNNNQRTELEMVQAGTLGGSWESTILLTVVDPRWTVWSLPWLFDSYAEAETVCESELGQAMLASLEPKGIKGLAYGFNGFRHLTNRKHPVGTLKDMQGLKIRVPSLPMFISLYRLWGADPSQMNFGDLIMALQEGAMDGQENPLHVIHSSGLHELQKYLTVWKYSFDPIVFCLSRNAWESLTPEQQRIVSAAARAAAKYQREVVVRNEKEHLKFLQEHGVTVTLPSPEAVEEFKKASKPIYDEYRAVIGVELFNRYLKATGNAG